MYWASERASERARRTIESICMRELTLWHGHTLAHMEKRKETKQIHVETSELICLFAWLFECRVWEYMSKFEHTTTTKHNRCGLLNCRKKQTIQLRQIVQRSTTHCYSLCVRVCVLFSLALSICPIPCLPLASTCVFVLPRSVLLFCCCHLTFFSLFASLTLGSIC